MRVNERPNNQVRRTQEFCITERDSFLEQSKRLYNAHFWAEFIPRRDKRKITKRK